MKNEKKILIKVLVCTVLHFEWLLGLIVSWKILAPLLDSSPGGADLFPFFISLFFFCLLCIDKENRNKKVASPHCTVGIQYTHLHWNATSRLPRLSSTFFHSVKSLCDCTFYIWSCIYFESNSKVNVDKFHPQSIYYDSKLLAPALLHWFKLFFGHLGKTIWTVHWISTQTSQ